MATIRGRNHRVERNMIARRVGEDARPIIVASLGF